MSFTLNRNPIFSAVCGLGIFLLTIFPLTGLSQLLKDASFELPTSGQPELGWTVCSGNPESQILDGNGPGVFGINTPPAHGQHYLGLVATNQGVSEAVGQPLKLEAGRHYYGNVALFRSLSHASWNGTGRLQIWGGTSCRASDELLWSSETVANVDQWRVFPIAFTPISNHTWLSLVMVLDAGSGEMTYICMDDLHLTNSYFAVDFLSFTAVPQSHDVLLEWETVALEDNLRFDVEWSNDGQQFQTIGTVEALATNSHFTFQHAAPQMGRQFYRIKTVDRGGHENLSEVRQVVFAVQGIQVFPNPVTQGTHCIEIAAEAEIQSLQLFDLNGRLLQVLEGNGTGQSSLVLPTLTNGCYLLHVQVKGKTFTQRLLVGQ